MTAALHLVFRTGKSLFLKALAGRLDDKKALRGTVRWNGMTQEEADAAGFKINRFTTYIDQVDVHMPVLTVRETFEFAVRHSNADVALLHPPSKEDATPLTTLQARKVDLMIDLLGLRECADTLVGDGALRGVSGGQRVSGFDNLSTRTTNHCQQGVPSLMAPRADRLDFVFASL